MIMLSDTHCKDKIAFVLLSDFVSSKTFPEETY
jgi:hypothetical protein